jgi:hypothetical protein
MEEEVALQLGLQQLVGLEYLQAEQLVVLELDSHLYL